MVSQHYEPLRNWYLIQTAAVDPAARTKKFDDKLMGELIRFVSSHEVGHTLGLRHNMGASSATPVEKLRDKEYQEKTDILLLSWIMHVSIMRSQKK
jgi:hypothetical protein